MGFIRGSLVVIAGVLLFTSFIFANLFLTLSHSLEYENVRPEIISISTEILQKDIGLTKEIENNFEAMIFYCQQYPEFVFSQEGYTFTIPCETISLGPEAVIEKGINDFVEEVYYKEYDCELFLDCSKQEAYPFFLVSKKSKDYWQSKFYLALSIAIILIILMLILMEHRLNLPFTVGIFLILSSLPFMKINWALSLFNLPFLQFVTLFFTKAYDVAWISLTTGLIVLGAGIFLKLCKIGFKIRKLFSEKGKEISKTDIKEIIKQEIFKHKKKDRKEKTSSK